MLDFMLKNNFAFNEAFVTNLIFISILFMYPPDSQNNVTHVYFGNYSDLLLKITRYCYPVEILIFWLFFSGKSKRDGPCLWRLSSQGARNH